MNGINNKINGISVEEYKIGGQPWLAKQIAAQAEAPGPVEERVKLLITLSHLPLKKQVLSFSRCDDRDNLVQRLVSQGEYGVLITLLHNDLARWLPEANDFEELQWLINSLLQVKEKTAGKKMRVTFQTPNGPQVHESAAMLETLQEEALFAAAGAWVRCLGGPGGDHRVFEIPGALADPELVEAIFIELTREPRALALLLEEKPLKLTNTALDNEELIKFLQRGVKTADFCLSTILSGINKIKASI